MAKNSHPLAIAVEREFHGFPEPPRTIELLVSEVGRMPVPGESIIVSVRVGVNSVNDHGRIFGTIQGGGKEDSKNTGHRDIIPTP